MNLPTPPKVRKLQEALHAKAKSSPGYRFYLLYDKVYRPDILAFAYERCRANRGAPGVDHQTFDDIKTYGVEQWLGELAQELRSRQYRPQPVRRVCIPKPDGGQRPLGIPTVKDRVVQTAAMLVLEPIFEADLQPEQYAYRSARGALDAVRVVRQMLEDGHTQVVDADLTGYFDSIPHRELMKSVARRVSDRHLLHLIKMWLKAPIHESRKGDDGPKGRSGQAPDEPRGTPQGAPLSPLLSNLYMRRFILAWKKWGCERDLDAHIVNYADDFVICCRGTAELAMAVMHRIMTRLKLTVNEAKTRLRRLPDETFDFLGYTFGRCYAFRTGRPYYGMRPSTKRVQRFCRSITEALGRNTTYREVADTVQLLNQKLKGWANYYCLGALDRAYRVVDGHVANRLRRWLRAKLAWTAQRASRVPAVHLREHFGLVELQKRRRILSWATA